MGAETRFPKRFQIEAPRPLGLECADEVKLSFCLKKSEDKKEWKRQDEFYNPAAAEAAHRAHRPLYFSTNHSIPSQRVNAARALRH
jgi:hypothetical protein